MGMHHFTQFNRFQPNARLDNSGVSEFFPNYSMILHLVEGFKPIKEKSILYLSNNHDRLREYISFGHLIEQAMGIVDFGALAVQMSEMIVQNNYFIGIVVNEIGF